MIHRCLFLVCLFVMLFSVEPYAARAQLSYPDEKHQIQTRSFGQFSVEKFLPDNSQRLNVLHAPLLRKESRFHWWNSTQQIQITFVDDGYDISFKLFGRQCIDGAAQIGLEHNLTPNTKESDAGGAERLAEYLHTAFGEAITSCLGKEQSEAMIAELRGQGEDFAKAGNQWKANSKYLFNGLERRCIKSERVILSHGIGMRCIEWSA